jgi:hypothetical protein
VIVTNVDRSSDKVISCGKGQLTVVKDEINMDEYL